VDLPVGRHPVSATRPRRSTSHDARADYCTCPTCRAARAESLAARPVHRHCLCRADGRPCLSPPTAEDLLCDYCRGRHPQPARQPAGAR
jgi:hypothetical protein